MISYSWLYSDWLTTISRLICNNHWFFSVHWWTYMHTYVLCLIISARLYFLPQCHYILCPLLCNSGEEQAREQSRVSLGLVNFEMPVLSADEIPEFLGEVRAGTRFKRCRFLTNMLWYVQGLKRTLKVILKSSFYSWMDNTRSGSRWVICLKSCTSV